MVGEGEGEAAVVLGEEDGEAFAEVFDGVGVGLAVACFTVCVEPAELQALFAICVTVGVGDGEGDDVVLVGEGVAAACSISPPPQPVRTTTALSATAPKANGLVRREEEMCSVIEAMRTPGKAGIGPPWTEKRKSMRMHRGTRYRTCGGPVDQGSPVVLS